MVDLICEYCQKPFTRRLADVNNCKRRGFLTVGCSRKCGLSLRNRHYSKTEEARTRLLQQSVLNNLKATKDPLERFFTRVLNNCKNRKNLVTSITHDDLASLWRVQSGCCAISGHTMEIPDMKKEAHENVGRKRVHLSPWRASLDRIDSSKGYIPGNVQFVCTITNLAKADFSMDELRTFCSLVHSKNSGGLHVG
jgi:hypothetical protein